MNNKLYVSNLSYRMTEDELKDAFASFGVVVSVRIITDRDTNQSRGFAFVEFETAEEASAALSAMNGQDVGGRELRVALAQEKR
jgi:RNA recognition motif-containing protein